MSQGPGAQGREPDASADRVAPRVQAEQIAQLYEATPMPVLAWAVWGHAPAAVVLGWLVVKLVLAAVRSTETRRYRADDARGARTGYWARRYIALMVLDTLSWAVIVPLFAPGADGLRLALLMCGVVGVAALGVFTTAAHLPASVIFSLTTMAPMGLSFAARGDAVGLAIAASTVIYGSVLVFEAWRSNARLTEMLRLRFQNAAIAEERAQALLVAEASSRAKTRFLASVSHEMRTPLNGILGLAEIVRSGTQETQQRQRLDTLARSARHLNRVLGDLLDYSAIEFDRLRLQPEPVRLADMVGEVTDLLAPAARERGLVLHVDRGPGLPAWVQVDPSRVKQVLHNLIGNAIKFTAEGSVRLGAEQPAPGQLAFTVHDTGPGVAVEDHERIFEAFERLSATGNVPGSGLGLAIARRLARAMGGDVVCVATGGAGARFVFTLLAPAAPPPAPERSDEPAGVFLAGRQLLVVDDNEVNALVARSMLELMGAAVDVAADGEAALQRLATARYDAVLMDCQMPRLDGYEATRRWRAQEAAGAAAARLPVIGVTANASADDRAACLEAGMDAHLPKPFRMAELAVLLKQHLGLPEPHGRGAAAQS
jgi:signal transduction histidine kinase/CheY-like chemotaxis protein